MIAQSRHVCFFFYISSLNVSHFVYNVYVWWVFLERMHYYNKIRESENKKEKKTALINNICNYANE